MQVTAGGQTDTASKTISVGNSPPVPTITGPSASLTWAVGDPLVVLGHRDRPPGRARWPPPKFTWTLAVEHCPSDCHEHIIETRTGITGGTFNAPDHDYPSYVRIYLRVTDSGGLSTTVHRDFQPKTGTIDAVSSPAGITLGVGAGSGRAATGRDRDRQVAHHGDGARHPDGRRGHLHVQQVVRRRRPQPPGRRSTPAPRT